MNTKNYHFIGIGGIGMSGLARIALSQNIEVSGSDLTSTYVTEGLVKSGAKVHIGHSAQHVSPTSTVVYSGDIKQDNPEYLAAINFKCPMLHRSDLLVQLMKPYKTLAVAGTHGKTTTSALLTSVMIEGGADPSYAVGGMIPQLQANGGHGKGEYFVAEADESDGTFLKYSPFGAIVTNIDFDHMDHYGTEEKLIGSFQTFMNKVSSSLHLFWCGDDVRLRALNIPGVSYGFEDHCDCKASNFKQNGWSITYDVEYNGKTFSQVEVALTGKHNALNSLAIFGLALSLGISEAAIRSAFKNFKGIVRRCEKKGDIQNILFLDDYAHHPTEVKATLSALRKALLERKLIAVFQPHRYSRTFSCLGSFGTIFDEADEVIVTDIYGARETPIPGLSHENIINEINVASNVPCRYVPRSELASLLANELRPHDCMVSLGAGDITKLSSEVLNKLAQLPPKKIKVGVVFGGRSTEHDISIISAKHIFNSLKNEYYDVVPFAIARKGKWIWDDKALEKLEQGSLKDASQGNDLLSHVTLQKLLECDVIFPVLHGPFGEDGTVQAFLEILGKAYVGCDYRSAAICMDKALTKKLVISEGIPTTDFVGFSHAEWKQDKLKICREIDQLLHYPMFVKPVHLGSSIGIARVEDAQNLVDSIEKAFKLDTIVLVENGIHKAREIEFAVLGNDEVTVFPPGEIPSEGQLYDYEAKYGPQGIKALARADLSPQKIEEGMRLAEKAYKAAGCIGMARVDFLLDADGKYWFNEINPIPGFTKISLYPQICEHNGLNGGDLMDKLIILGLHQKRRLDRVM